MNDATKAAVEWLRRMATVGAHSDPEYAERVLARLDGEPERLAAKAEEVREACAQWVMRADVTWDTLWECGDAIRATPLTATPLADRLKAAENERDHFKASLVTERKWHVEALERAKAAEARVAELEYRLKQSLDPIVRAEMQEPPPPIVVSDPSGALTRFDRKLFHELLDILGREVGNRGDSEGAVDVVERIIRERDEAVAALRALLPEVYGTHSPSTVGYAIDRHRIIAQARAVLAKYPEGR